MTNYKKQVEEILIELYGRVFTEGQIGKASTKGFDKAEIQILTLLEEAKAEGAREILEMIEKELHEKHHGDELHIGKDLWHFLESKLKKKGGK